MFESERRDLAYVPRWSILRVNRRQSVAEHSFFVCCYGLKIAETLQWLGDYHALAVYLLRHDEAEALESDIPGPVKRSASYERSRELDSALKDRFGKGPVHDDKMLAIRRTADLIDECLYLAGEMSSGNSTVKTCFDYSVSRLTSSLDSLFGTENDRALLALLVKEAIHNELTNTKNLNGLI